MFNDIRNFIDMCNKQDTSHLVWYIRKLNKQFAESDKKPLQLQFQLFARCLFTYFYSYEVSKYPFDNYIYLRSLYRKSKIYSNQSVYIDFIINRFKYIFQDPKRTRYGRKSIPVKRMQYY